MNRIILIAFGLWAFTYASYSQRISITGESPNYFLKVDEVFANGVRITATRDEQFQHFLAGDKALVIQMTGISIDSTGAFKTTLSRSKKSIGNTGKFEILQIEEVNTSGADTIIYFTDNLSNNYDNWEKIQLVKLVEAEMVQITGTLTTYPWDGNVGGILAIIGIDTVKLSDNSRIDVTAQGFRGGAIPLEAYPDYLCRSRISKTVLDTFYFRPNQLYRSGNKGEGVITTRWPYTKGTGFNINGGGAGNGLLAGGGGGSNFLPGGDGGYQSSICDSVIGGIGGYGCYELYGNPLKPNVVIGGGGGSGTKISGYSSSRGGNGGGLIIIITETFVTGINASVRSSGENANPSVSTGSGGGGGGGGTILIDAGLFQGSKFSVQIHGGIGATTSNLLSYCTGAGGGGSGGVFWYSGNSSPNITLDSLNGSGGVTQCGSSFALNNGVSGNPGVRLKNLIVPLTGFLFNTIRGTDTICETQTPGMLTASRPKGGNGTYGYQWQQSTDKISWMPAAGVGQLLSFAPVALVQTTYYRRIVTSQNPVTMAAINDTSRTIEVFVYPAISNNSILGTDTICYHLDAKPLSGSAIPLSGGNNIFTYKWQESTDQEQWGLSGSESSFDPGRLDTTTYYRRIVNSTAYCADTSGYIKVSVLQSISGNQFSVTDSSICENSSPGRIRISLPAGGDGLYSYQWQYNESDSWVPLAMTTDSVMFTAGILTDTISYRRIVYSGNDNACIDTSNSRTFFIRPLISGNKIEGAPVQYTCYNSTALLHGSQPSDGFGAGTYGYSWEESNDQLTWQAIAASTGQDLVTDKLTAARFFRRTVYSGQQYHECTDVSGVVEVKINPLPTGNVFNAYDTLCAGSTLHVKFNVAGNGPFNVMLRGDNITADPKTGITGPVDSIAVVPLSTQEFTLVSIEDDSSCFADATGFIPVIAGIVYEVPVAQAGDDAPVCAEEFTLQAVKSNQNYHGLWSGTNCSFSDPALENGVVTVDHYGPNLFTWTESNWHCTDEDEVEITFYEQPALPDAGIDQELDFIFHSQLAASVPTVGNGKWTVISGTAGFDDDSKPDALISELSDQTHLKWTITNGTCPAVSDSLTILVHPLSIPKGFTPNGNNKNDFFDPGANHAEKITIKIFNSAGILVYESENYTDAAEHWKGENMKGVKLPEGTYFYIMNIKVEGKTEEVQFKSFIELIR